MPSEALHPLADQGGELNTLHLEFRGFRGSGDEGDIRLEALARDTPTLGTSRLAQTPSLGLADLLQDFSVSRNFLFCSNSTALGTALFDDQPQRDSFERRQETVPELLPEIQWLTSTIETEPVEDGVSHPGESVIAEIVDVRGADALADMILQIGAPSLAAAALRLFGRVASPSAGARQRLIEHGLHSESVEIRDAVVQSVELWKDQDAVHMLEKHQEPVPWLAEYIRSVVEELGD